MIDSTVVVFVHGMYMNAASWQPWQELAGAQGYTTHAPSWPYHEGQPAGLRARVDPGLGRLTFGKLVEHYKSVLATLPSRPVLIGHSVGGLVVQKLVNEGHAAAAVVVSPAPPRGILSLDPHFFRANFPHLNPLAGNRPIAMTPARFHYAFANTVSRQKSDELFERYAVPESRNVPRSTVTGQGAIDFARPHVPLLFLGGDEDHLTPLPMVLRNARAYRKADGRLDVREFAHKSHFICNEPGWEAVAEQAFDWLGAL
jgi:pimeloyl-ACP methyl ester carboxylesterase